MKVGAASVDDVGDVGESERHGGEIGGVLLLVVGDTSPFWRSASLTCCSDVTLGEKNSEPDLSDAVDFLLRNDL